MNVNFSDENRVTTSNSLPPSSANEVKHGFCSSSFVVVRLEDLKEVANLKADLVACYKPVNSQELMALQRMAISQQQMLRGARLEAGLFTSALDEALDQRGDPIRPMSVDLAGDGDIEIARAQNRNFAAAEGFRRIAKESDNWALLIRFQTHAERQYRRAVEEFDRLKKLRPELPNEPGIGTGPEPPADLIMELTPEPAPWPPPPAVPTTPPSNTPAPTQPESEIKAAQTFSPAPLSATTNENEASSLSQYLLAPLAVLCAFLKGSPQPELQLPPERVVQNAGAPSVDRRISRRHVRRRPVHVVQNVERIHSKRKLHAFGHVEIFDQ